MCLGLGRREGTAAAAAAAARHTGSPALADSGRSSLQTPTVQQHLLGGEHIHTRVYKLCFYTIIPVATCIVSSCLVD